MHPPYVYPDNQRSYHELCGIYIALYNVTCSLYVILCMFVQYRRDLSYTDEALESARRSLARLDRAVQRLEQQLRESTERNTGMNTTIRFIYCVPLNPP